MSQKTGFDAYNQKFESRLQDYYRRISDSELTPKKREIRRSKCDGDILAFAKTYYPNIYALPWNDLHRWLASLRSGAYFMEAFPESGKSALGYLKMVVHPLVINIGGLLNINTQTLTISKAKIDGITRLIKNNRMLCYDYDIKFERESMDRVIFKDTHLVPGSVETGLRNLTDDDFSRIVRQFNDDLYDIHTVASAIKADRTIDFVEGEALRQMDSHKSTLSLTVGNAISENSPILYFIGKYPESSIRFPALDKEGNSNWPEFKKSEKEWRAYWLDKKIPFHRIQSEWLGKPLIKGDVLDPAWIQHVYINTVQILASLTAHDPAHGQSPAACYKAGITVSVTSSNEVVVTDCYLRKESYTKFFDYIDKLRDRIQKWKVLCWENDFAQWDFAEKYYTDWRIKNKKIIPIHFFQASQLYTKNTAADKDSRLLSLVHPHQTGWVKYAMNLKGIPDFEDIFKAHYCALGKSKDSLDGLDALASAIILVFRWIEKGSFKPTRKRAFQGVKRLFSGGGFHG